MGCSLFWAILLIIIGLWIWASNHNIIQFRFSRDWPLILIAIGIYLLFSLKRKKIFIR